MRKIISIISICFALMLLVQTVSAFKVTPLSEESIVVELTATADSLEAAENKAKRDALRGTVGRMFLNNELLMADEILVKYIDNYAEQFIDGVEVLEDDFIAGESIINAKVYVNFEKFQKDLREKRFIYQPAYKPNFSTFMKEVLNGDISNNGSARDSLTNALENLGMRPFPSPLQTPPSSTDVLADSFLLNAAVISAQRSGVEIVISGEATTTLIDTDKLYFDDYYFYETEMKASLLRVDTQEVLATSTAKGSAADTDEETAIKLSLDRASELIGAELFAKYDDYWPKVVKMESDFEVLFTGINDELIDVIEQNIYRMGRNIEVNERKQFDKSAVLTINVEGLSEENAKQQLIENLNSCPYPTLYILNPEDESSFEVQVSS